MATKLDELLLTIDPSRNLDQTAARAHEALNSFPMKVGRVDRWEEFRCCLTDFFCHVESRVLRLHGQPHVSARLDWGRCVRMLTQEYGAGGDKTAFELARTGNEGGLYDVLNRLARRIAEQYAGNEVSARICHWLNALSVDERLKAMDDYVAKYGHLLPSELTERGAVRIKANFTKVLEEHPRLVQRLRRVGR
jgi:hypothetical protein